MGKYHLSKSKGSKALRISSGALGGTDFQHGKIIWENPTLVGGASFPFKFWTKYRNMHYSNITFKYMKRAHISYLKKYYSVV